MGVDGRVHRWRQKGGASLGLTSSPVWRWDPTERPPDPWVPRASRGARGDAGVRARARLNFSPSLSPPPVPPSAETLGRGESLGRFGSVCNF